MPIENSIQRQLSANELAVGLGVRHFRNVEICGVALEAGYDWLFIDLEHGSISLETVSQISNTAILAGCAPIVRVPRADFNTACQALDGGALGVIFPHIGTAEDARRAVDHVRYPPVGRRSIAARQPALGFAAEPARAAMDALDAKTLVFAMIESAEGTANVEAIAAVPGIDILFVGANDLAIDLGITDGFDAPEFREAVERIIAAGRRHGKTVGMGGIRSGEQLRCWLRAGVAVLLGDMESSLIIEGGRAQTSALRAMVAER